MKNRKGVWLLNITPVPMRQNQGFLLFLITQSGVKTIEYFHCTCRITLEIFREWYAEGGIRSTPSESAKFAALGFEKK